MPRIEPQLELIRVPLNDRIIDNTIIKQQAVFSMLVHRQDIDTKECTVNVGITIQSYSDKDGELGQHLHEFGLLDKSTFMVADNNTLVDATDGTILLIKDDTNRADWDTLVAAYQQPTMYQGDFFWSLRKTPVVIEDLIVLHIHQANAMGNFN